MNAIPFEHLGPYRIERSLGHGGMGSVYLGVDEDSGQQAAVKVLSPSLANDESFRLRFGTEIETLKKITHPNIVQLLGFGEQEGHLFYAMEYIDGQTLQDELKLGRCFDWHEVARIGVECCHALKHAHDRGIIHRDLKPANLIYTLDRHVKLLDFGIAKLYGMTQLTVAGGVLGTVDFMAPEQAEGRSATARSDLYSLGGVMFALLTRRPPFIGNNIAEVLHKLRYDEAPLVRTLVPDVPREFEFIIAQLLAKDPDRRLATALALANRLKAMEYALSPETLVEPDAGDSQSADRKEQRDETPGQEAFLDDSDVTLARAPTMERLPAGSDSLRRHQNPTVSMSELRRSDAAAVTPVPEQETAETHFTTFDEEARRRALRPDETIDTTPLWLKIGPVLGAAAIIAVGVWYLMLPPSPDRLYEKIMAVGDDADPQNLVRVEDSVNQFLKLCPNDPRSAAVRSIKEEIDLYRLQKRYERRARLRGGVDSLDAVERAYLDASRLADTDPAAAVRKLHAFLNVFDDPAGDADTTRFVRLAREQLEQLTERANEIAATQLQTLQQRLDAADQLQGEDPKRADAIRRGIIELYQSALWARPAVERAHADLQAGAEAEHEP